MMSSDEEKRILKMVADGVITPEEAMNLIKALETDGSEPVEGVDVIDPESGSDSVRSAGVEFEQVQERALRFSKVPLAVGVVLTILASYWLFSLVQNTNYGLWFVCAWIPLLLGIVLVALSSGGSHSRWVYVNVEQASGEWPQHITFGLPLPLGLLGWAMRNFGHQLRGMQNLDGEEILNLLSTATREAPLVVNVQDDLDGDRVQVYIG
jgi:hypothetical protein